MGLEIWGVVVDAWEEVVDVYVIIDKNAEPGTSFVRALISHVVA